VAYKKSKLSYSTVLRRLGPVLFKGEWIESLTARQRWLIESGPGGRWERNASIMPARVSYVSGSTVSTGDREYDEALRMEEFQQWQHGKIKDWLRRHRVKVTQSEVDTEQFERAFAQALAACSSAATPSGDREPSTAPSASHLRRDRNGHVRGQPPQEFHDWVASETASGRSIITISEALPAMKKAFPRREPARDTVISWVKRGVPEERQAKRGTPPYPARQSTDRD
jgi:hypothetical protein